DGGAGAIGSTCGGLREAEHAIRVQRGLLRIVLAVGFPTVVEGVLAVRAGNHVTKSVDVGTGGRACNRVLCVEPAADGQLGTRASRLCRYTADLAIRKL